MQRDDPLYTLTLDDFKEQLELHGVSPERLDAKDLDRLRYVYDNHRDAQWNLFESIAIAAQSFAGQAADQREMTAVTPRWLWDALVDTGNATNARLNARGELIVTAYSQDGESGGCGNLVGDFVVMCQRISIKDEASREGE